MSSVALCTDSSAVFPAGIADALGVTVVPIAIALDGVPLVEQPGGIDDFYAQLAEGAAVTTSQPSPGAFLEAYSRAAAAGASEALSIHLDARVSGTSASAELAAREAPIPVTVVDTGTASFGVGVCVRAAAEAIADGTSAGAAAEAARRAASGLRNVFVAAGAATGRVSGGSGWSVLELAGGTTRVLAASETEDEAIARMVASILSTDGPLRAAVGHAAAIVEPAADALAGQLVSSPRVVELERYRVGPAVGAHTGPLSFGAFWWPAD